MVKISFSLRKQLNSFLIRFQIVKTFCSYFKFLCRSLSVKKFCVHILESRVIFAVSDEISVERYFKIPHFVTERDFSFFCFQSIYCTFIIINFSLFSFLLFHFRLFPILFVPFFIIIIFFLLVTF